MPPEIVPIASVDIRPEDIEAVASVLASGRLRQGRVVAEFEEAFATRVGARHAVAVSSGTAALHVAYLALFKPGDEVIVPAFTFVATASMVLAVGAVPVFADVDPRTFTLSLDDVRSRITARTRGIVGVHLFGNACDVDGLTQLAADHGLTLVWDAAQALGTEYGGRDVGSYPSASCFSFYPTKNITTGEGGMITTDEPALADTLRLLRSQGAAGKYVHTVLGFNYRMTDFQAAIGLRQIRRLDDQLRRRRDNAEAISGELAAVARVIDAPLVTPGAVHSYNQYSVLCLPPLRRDDIAADLARSGIETAVHYPRPLHHQPLFASADITGPLNESESLCGKILALPVHPGVAHADARLVGAALADVAERALTEGRKGARS